jgi:hypothetical protein
MLVFPLTDHTWLDVHTRCEPTLLHNKENLVSKIQMIWCVVHSHGVSDMHVSACMDVCMCACMHMCMRGCRWEQT